MSYIGNEPIVSATRTVTEITATAGQTTFTANGGYTVGYIDVFVNGAQLQTSDFTATNGSTITLNSPATIGDDIRLVAWGTFSTSNLVSPNYTGTLTGGTGVVNIGSGQIFKDASGNVGIGTSSPSFPLQVSSGTSGNISFMVNPPGLTNFAVIPSNSGSTGTRIGTTGGDTLAFITNNTERMRITSGGIVAIGDTSVTNTSASLSIYSPLGAATGNPWTNNQITVGSTSAMAAGVGGLINFEGSFLTGTPGGANFAWIKGAKTNGTSGDATGDLILGSRGGNIRFSNDTTNSGLSSERMRIDASGRVTKPNQPAFFVREFSGATYNSGTVTGGTVVFDVGSNYNTSNGRFTAPVAGRYFFAMGILVETGTGRLEGNMNVNGGSQRVNFNGTGTTYDGPVATAVFNLSAGDYVQIVRQFGTAFASPHGNNYFTGYFLG